MTKYIRSIVAIGLLIILTPSAIACQYDVDKDYMAEMIEAALEGDFEAGLLAEYLRNEKIDVLDLDFQKVSFEDLFYLSRQIEIEAGSSWLSEEHQLMVGNVVLNRVDGDSWPDTVKEVIEAPCQYAKRNILPSARAIKHAILLLEGERILPEGVVYQSGESQGSGTYATIYDDILGTTYFCWE